MPPFGRDSIAVLAHRIVHEPPELGALTGGLRELVAECLDKDPARRPSAGVLLMRLLGHSTLPAEQYAPTAILAEGVTAAAVLPSGGGPPTRQVTPVADGLPETHAMSAATVPPTAAAPPPKKGRSLVLALAGLATALVLAAGAIALAALHDHRGSPVPGPTKTVFKSSTGPAQTAPASGAGRSSSSSAAGSRRSRRLRHGGGLRSRHRRLTCTVTLRGGGAPLDWTATVTEPLSLEFDERLPEPGDRRHRDHHPVPGHPACGRRRRP